VSSSSSGGGVRRVFGSSEDANGVVCFCEKYLLVQADIPASIKLTLIIFY